MNDERGSGRTGETSAKGEKGSPPRHARPAFLARAAAFPAQRSAFIVQRLHACCGLPAERRVLARQGGWVRRWPV